MMFNLLINPDAIPKGQALKRDAEIYIGANRINVTSQAKKFIQAAQTALGHKSERNTVEHLIETLAVSAEQDRQRNRRDSENAGGGR
jgi:hypothetical protein